MGGERERRAMEGHWYTSMFSLHSVCTTFHTSTVTASSSPRVYIDTKKEKKSSRHTQDGLCLSHGGVFLFALLKCCVRSLKEANWEWLHVKNDFMKRTLMKKFLLWWCIKNRNYRNVKLTLESNLWLPSLLH